MLGATPVNATAIIAVDLLQQKLEQARDIGATELIVASQQDPLSKILEITGGTGVDYAIESAGRRETMETAFKSVRENGGLCVLAGNLPFGENICLNPFDLIKGKRVTGAWEGDTQPDRDIPMYTELYLSGRPPLNQLITDNYQLEDVNQALEALEQGKVGRALIDMKPIQTPTAAGS